MSASAAEQTAVKTARDDHHRAALRRGHMLRWSLGENARRRGYTYFWYGRCEPCATEITVGSMWSSCPEVRDARRVDCSGPGTAVLTETNRAHALSTTALLEFLHALTTIAAQR